MYKHIFAMTIRYLFVAPIMAFALLTTIFIAAPDKLGGWTGYLLLVGFLSVLPLLAYPLQPLIKGFRGRGREGQRDLAIVTAVLGYIAAVVSSLAAHLPKPAVVISFTYFLSGLLIAAFNKLLLIRASGHACGVSGPVAAAVTFLGPWALLAILALPLVYWASLQTKRHTVPQLIWGTIIPWVAFALAYGLASLI